MGAGEDPGLVRSARRVGASRAEVAAHLDDACPAGGLLRKDVAKDTALFLLVVLQAGTELVEHAARNKSGCGELRVGMGKLLSRCRTEILEHADVAEAGVAFEVLNALGHEQEELLDFRLAGVPKMAVVLGVFDQQLVSAHVGHAVVDAFAAPVEPAFDVINRAGMDDGAGRPGASLHRRTGGNLLQFALVGRAWTQPALRLRSGSEFGEIVSRHHPGAG